MGQVVNCNLDDEVVVRLKQRAERHHRSLESELREILTEAAPLSRPELAARAKELAKSLQGRWSGDSTSLIREDRDR